METLTLNDGTVLENSHALLSGNVLWVYIRNGSTMETVFYLMNDPDKTKKIVEDRYGEKNTYRGYTKLFSVSQDSDEQISAGLRK